MDTYSISWIIMWHHSIYFVAQLWLLGALSGWLLSSFDVHPFLNTSLISGTVKFILCFTCFVPRIGHFSKEPWFFCVKGNHGLGTWCAHSYYPVTASWPPEQTELENVYTACGSRFPRVGNLAITIHLRFTYFFNTSIQILSLLK